MSIKNHTNSFFVNRSYSFLLLALCASVFIFGGANTAMAAVTVTAATGGTNISADKAANATAPAYTTLGNIVIAENANNDFAANQNNRTLILTAPTGWQFNAGVGSVSYTSNRDITSASVSVTSSIITVTFSTDSNANRSDTLTISGIQVRATNGGSLPSSGTIFRTAANPGTATIAGITNDSTSFGALSQVAGTVSKLAFTTHPGSATYGSVLGTQPVVKSQDQFGNLSTTGLGASKVVTLTLTSGTGSLQGTNTSDIGTSAGNGVATFSGLSVNTAGTGKVLTAAAASLTSAVSNSFTINQLAAVLAGTRTYDTTTSVAFGILSVSNRVDADDVTVTSGSGTIASADVGAQSITSFGTLALGGTKAGNYTLTGATGTVTITQASQTITFNTLSDKTLGDADFLVSATASSGLTVAFSSLTTGVCTVTTATVHLVAPGTCTIRASQSGNGNYTAATPVDRSFSVASGAVKFVILPPSSGTVGAPVMVTVQAQKSDNSIDTNYQQDVTLNTTGSATGAGVVNIVNGVGMKDISDTVAETITLSLTDSQATGLNVTSTQQLAFAVGPVASFALNNPGDVYAKVRLGYTVSRFDTYGNAVGVATTTVYLYSSSTSGTKKFYSDSLVGSVITSIDIAPGHSTANFWYYDEAPGTYTITASDSTPTADGSIGIVDATDPVTVMPVATKFVIMPASNGTVDAPITVTVQAQKPDNSIDTNYQQDVTLNTTGSATGGGVVDIVNGVGTKNISDTVAETANLSLYDSQSTGLNISSTQSVTFGVGAIAQFTLSHPASLVAGQRAAYTITRTDQYGNLNSLATSTVYLYSSSVGANKKFYDAASVGNVITSVQIPNGQSSVQAWYYDETPGTYTITASDNASAPDYNLGINDATDSLDVSAGSVATFLLSHTGDMTAGTRLEFSVTRKDQFNNLVTSGATAAYLFSNSTGTSSPAFYNVSSGGTPIESLSIVDGQSSAAFWYFDPNPGTWTVTASETTPANGPVGVVDAVDSITVQAAPIHATRFVIMPPTNGTVDATISITVKAEDADGNVDSTYQNDVTLNISGSATGGGLVDIVNGVGTKNISDTVAQTVNLSLADSQGTGLNTSSTQSIAFAPGAVAQLAINNPGDMAAGTRISYTVSRKDQYGNAVTSGATMVNLSSSSTGVNKKFYDAASGGSAITSIEIPDGASSVGFWSYDEKAGNWLITAGATGLSSVSDPIIVQPAALAKFTLNDPGNMTAGTRLGYTVTRKDQFDNLVASGVTLAYFYSSSTATTTAFYTSDVGGAPTAFATINDGSSSGAVWYYDETPGTWLVTVSDSSSSPNGALGIADASDSVTVSAIPIVATRFVILPVSSVQAGTPATVTIQAQDNNGNIDTTIQSGVTLLSTGSATGAGLVSMINGVGTKTLQDTVAETVTLSLSDSQSTGLNVSSTQSLTFSIVPPTPVSGAGGGTVAPMQSVTGVELSGLAPAGATIQVLAVSPTGSTIQGQTTANARGSFYLLLKEIAYGVSSYGVVGMDALGRMTQTKVFNGNYANKNDLLQFNAILLSPTLGLVHQTVRKGDVVGFVGNAVPGYAVGVQVDGKRVASGTVAADGSYKILLPTTNLSLGSHTAQVRQVSPAGVQSEYTPQKVFIVTSLFTPQTDFNQDGVINVQDWSIFLSRWSSTNKATRMLDDLNGDGKVDVSDLSIFVRTLKK